MKLLFGIAVLPLAFSVFCTGTHSRGTFVAREGYFATTEVYGFPSIVLIYASETVFATFLKDPLNYISRFPVADGVTCHKT